MCRALSGPIRGTERAIYCAGEQRKGNQVAHVQPVIERGKSFRTKTLRLHALENRIFEQACEALNGMERTQLMQEAVIHEAARLGVWWTVDPVAPLSASWPYLPDRGDEPTEVRVSITVSLPVAEIITRAAEHVHASEPMFIIGATLAHVGRLKACFKGIHAETPEGARVIRAGLDKIKLPPRYQHPRHTK
jgi:uncharacterized protein (DUF1778 family)